VTRTCPSCRTTYPDAVFFCGQDGTVTVQDQDPRNFDDRLGKRLGGYIVVARVADGAMGRVFEGRHPETKARVAIKVLHAHVARDPISVERFKREYESALELKHPYVVKVLEFGDTPDGSHFLTMEYLEGTELGRVVGCGQPLAPARALRIICQVALALEHAHGFGFIHRDLKPDNVFLRKTPEGDEVRVLDFGSVKLQLDMGAKLTAIGTTVGSPFYMSPEQAMGRSDVDQRTDVFALGAILYEMLTDRVAFDAPNLAKILLRIMKDSPDPPSAINPSVPKALDAVLAEALAKSKEERYASPRALASAMIAAYGLEGSVEDWARRPQAEVEQSLIEKMRTTPVEGQAPVADTAPARAVADAASARAPGKDERGDATVPKLALPAEDRSTSTALPRSTTTGRALLALAVFAVIGLLVLLLR
jgi:serine/threonine-protein kinase